MNPFRTIPPSSPERSRRWAGRFAFVAAVLAAAEAQASSPWTPGFEKASQRAIHNGNDILLVFTARRFNAACRQFERYFLTKPAFAEALAPHFELVWLDVSEHGGDQEGSPAFRLRRRFEVNSFPAVILTNSVGQPYAYTGLRPGSLDKYLDYLEQLRQKNIARKELLLQARQARGLPRASLLARSIPELGRNRSAKFYGDIMREIIALDPGNESPKTLAIRRQLADWGYAERMRDLDQELRWSEMVELTREHIRDQNLTGARKQAALMDRLDVQRRQEDIPGVLQTLRDIIQINPYSRHGQHASMILSKITSDIENQATLANPDIED